MNKRPIFKKVNHFERIKGVDKTFSFPSSKHFIYYDTETFEFYEDAESEEPKIIPYLVGVIDTFTKQYKLFIGVNAGLDFANYIFGHKDCKDSLRSISHCSSLVAFNADYDFHAIRPWIEDEYKDVIYINYMMSDNKQFVAGGFSTKENKGPFNKVDIRLLDLWLWDRTQSLKSSIKAIRELVWDSNEAIKETDIAKSLYAEIKQYGFDKTNFNKTEIDYKKVNLHYKDGKYYYWSSREEWIDGKEPKELDLEGELNYLKTDVCSLPVVHKLQKLFRKELKKVLELTEKIDNDSSLTIPSYCKYLFEEYYVEFMTQSYRCSIPVEDYKEMELSYIGAFTASNKDILYIDEEIFKRLYPSESFYDKGIPKIRSYDVNSMYPFIISKGLPYGRPSLEKPSNSSYAVWYEICFKEYLDLDTNTLYDWKPEYSCFNNCFFGSNFHAVVDESGRLNKVYVLKELYELFLETCNAKCEIVNIRYQPINKNTSKFIKKLYSIKENKKGLYTEFQVKSCKLALNSLYGKFAERYKDYSITWVNDIMKYRDDVIAKMTADDIPEDELLNKIKIFKKYISYEYKGSGLVLKENTSKRYDSRGMEVRENITAGLYITQKARQILIKAMKEEIDNGNIILNCDTDSIKMLQRKKPKFRVDSSKLGAWKEEGQYTHFAHPNSLKKYWTANLLTKELTIKCAGIPIDKLHDRNKYSLKESIFILKTIYDPSNYVVIRRAKNKSYRNSWFQVVIDSSDVEFIARKDKTPHTHSIVEGVLTCLTP